MHGEFIGKFLKSVSIKCIEKTLAEKCLHSSCAPRDFFARTILIGSLNVVYRVEHISKLIPRNWRMKYSRLLNGSLIRWLIGRKIFAGMSSTDAASAGVSHRMRMWRGRLGVALFYGVDRVECSLHLCTRLNVVERLPRVSFKLNGVRGWPIHMIRIVLRASINITWWYWRNIGS